MPPTTVPIHIWEERNGPVSRGRGRGNGVNVSGIPATIPAHIPATRGQGTPRGRGGRGRVFAGVLEPRPAARPSTSGPPIGYKIPRAPPATRPVPPAPSIQEAPAPTQPTLSRGRGRPRGTTGDTSATRPKSQSPVRKIQPRTKTSAPEAEAEQPAPKPASPTKKPATKLVLEAHPENKSLT